MSILEFFHPLPTLPTLPTSYFIKKPFLEIEVGSVGSVGSGKFQSLNFFELQANWLLMDSILADVSFMN